MNSGISAAIVLFNPDIDLLKDNIDALWNQVDKIYLYDNGSENVLLIEELLEKYSSEKYSILKSKINNGLGKGLNDLIRVAMLEGYKWVLTVDQDSICASNMINEYSTFLDYDKAAILCPFVLNNNKVTLGEYRQMHIDKYEYITKSIKCITSGCLVNVSIALKIGLYNESLFVDCVDNEFFIRVLQAGYRIIKVNTTYLIQQMGVGRRLNFLYDLSTKFHLHLLRKLSIVTENSDYRLYLGNRNAKYIRKTYSDVDLNYSALYLFFLNFYFVLTYPFKRNRVSMIYSIIKGNLDWKQVHKIENLDYMQFSPGNLYRGEKK